MHADEELEQSLLAASGVWDSIEAMPREPGIGEGVKTVTLRDECHAKMRFMEFDLNSFERTAIELLNQSESAIVSAPTAVGKTLLAAYFINYKLKQSIRVFYLVPIRALADEIFLFLQQLFGKMVGYSHGAGQFNKHAQILVLTYEKFEVLTLSENIQNCFVVIDEFHFMLQSARGAVIERLLVFLKSANQFLCMSATISGLSDISAWTGFATLHFDKSYRPFAVEEVTLRGGGALDAVLEEILRSGQNCMVFCQSRSRVRALAMRYAGTDELAAPQVENKDLRRCMRGGTAFHSAGLSRGDERLVENAFQSGAVKLLFCTTTLAYGVNLDAQNVVLSCVHGEQLFEASDATQISGRAGRQSPGKAFFVDFSAEPVEHSRILDDLLKTAQISALRGMELESVLQQSYALFQYEVPEMPKLLQLTGQTLQKLGIATENGQITAFGRRVTRIYEPVSDVANIIKIIENTLPRARSTAAVFAAAMPQLTEEQLAAVMEISGTTERCDPVGVMLQVLKSGMDGDLGVLTPVFEEFTENAPRIAELAMETAAELLDGPWTALLAREAFLIEHCVCNELLLESRVQADRALVHAIRQHGGDVEAALAGAPERWRAQIDSASSGIKERFQAQLQPGLFDCFTLKVSVEENAVRIVAFTSSRLLLFEFMEPGTSEFQLEIKPSTEPELFIELIFKDSIGREHFNLHETKRVTSRTSLATEYSDLLSIAAEIEQQLLNGMRVAILGGATTVKDAEERFSSRWSTANVQELAVNASTELAVARGQVSVLLGNPFANSDDLVQLGYLVYNEAGVECGQLIESCLDLHLGVCFGPGDTPIAEFMEVMGQTLLVQRLQHNPSYYGLAVQFQLDRDQEVTTDSISEFISRALEEEVDSDNQLSIRGDTIHRGY